MRARDSRPGPAASHDHAPARRGQNRRRAPREVRRRNSARRNEAAGGIETLSRFARARDAAAAFGGGVEIGFHFSSRLRRRSTFGKIRSGVAGEDERFQRSSLARSDARALARTRAKRSARRARRAPENQQ